MTLATRVLVHQFPTSVKIIQIIFDRFTGGDYSMYASATSGRGYMFLLVLHFDNRLRYPFIISPRILNTDTRENLSSLARGYDLLILPL